MKTTATTPAAADDRQFIHVVIYSAVLLLAATALVYLWFLFIDKLPSVYRQYSLMTLFLAAGLLHLLAITQWQQKIHAAAALGFTLLMTVTIAAVAWMIFYFYSTTAQQHILTLACAFALPFLLYSCVKFYKAIPPSDFKDWTFPENKPIPNRTSLLLNSIYFTLHIKNTQQDQGTKFSVTFSRNFTLGDAFRRFLADQRSKESPLYIPDAENNAWRFTMNDWVGSVLLYPEKTLRQNGIKEDSIVTAERLLKN